MPPQKRTKTHADEFRDLEHRAPQDYDPEDEFLLAVSDDDDDEDSDSNSEAEVGNLAAREHYEPVGQTKLRRLADSTALGQQYAGTQIRRENIEDVDDEDQSHDPLAGYMSDAESDVDMRAASENQDDEASSRDSDDDDPEEDDMTTDDTSISDDAKVKADSNKLEDDRAALRRIMQEQNNVAATINQAAQQDAEKGRAVKRQRKTFDSLLNSRIRLQQGLTAFNALPEQASAELSQRPEHDTIAAAEQAAMNLWNTLESLRRALAPTSEYSDVGKAAFRITTQTSTASIWNHMQQQESASKPARDATLDKWSRRTASANAQFQQAANPRRLNPTAPSQTPITAILAEHLSASKLPQLVARTQSSTTSARSAKSATTQEPSTKTELTYEDAEFYASLLQDLLSQRQQDELSTSTPTDKAANKSSDLANEVKSQYQAARRATKAHKNVDTKASKGRKLRYTVHEKLLNFMAPLETGSWGDRQREELFTSLLGKRIAAGSNGAVSEKDGNYEVNGDGREEEALMLFRS